MASVASSTLDAATLDEGLAAQGEWELGFAREKRLCHPLLKCKRVLHKAPNYAEFLNRIAGKEIGTGLCNRQVSDLS